MSPPEQPRLSLGSEEAFLWRVRLREQRAIHNITHAHGHVIEHLRMLIEAGDDQPSQAEIAAALQVSLSTVWDALRRARALGFIGSAPQFITVNGHQRRTVNRYWLMPPPISAGPRPELRRHRTVRFQAASKQVKIKGNRALQDAAGSARASLAQIAAARERQIAASWFANRRRESG
jgi:DNA-binding transcriptional MocR family regulator